MKNISVFLVLGTLSLSTFANEYIKATTECILSGDHTSFSSAKNEKLPNEINFKVEMTRFAGENKYRKLEVIGTDLLQAESAYQTVTWDSSYIRFSDLDREESRQILEALGATEVPELPSGFKFSKMYYKFFQFGLDVANSRSQVHFPLSKNDGLSYHINIKCSLTVNGR